MNKNFVLKIGGSILYDNLLNVNKVLLDKVKNWYYGATAEYNKVVIVVGGGKLSRDLQSKIAGSVGGEEYLHSIGINATQTNAALVKAFIEDPNIYLPKKLGDAYEYLWGGDRRVMLSGGLKVGWSTDMDAAVFADILDVDQVYKISNINYVYEQDPNVNPNASIVKDLSWGDYFDQFNILQDSYHKANDNIPIDIGCARFCSEKEISFFISGGKSVYEKETVIDIFTEGTLIHP
jgi:uridylate kinase